MTCTYDFTNATNLNALGAESLVTVATGKYSSDPLVNPTYKNPARWVGNLFDVREPDLWGLSGPEWA